MNEEIGDTVESQFAIGFDSAHIATVVLGMTDKAFKGFIKSKF